MAADAACRGIRDVGPDGTIVRGRGSSRRVRICGVGSATTRRWFGHDRARFAEFRRRYSVELATQKSKLRELRQRACKGTLTLVYGARDTEHNDAVVLAEILRRGIRSGGVGQKEL